MEPILKLLDSHRSHLTGKEKRVCEFIRAQHNQVFLLKSKELAERADVSEATISRFVRKLGFANYIQFKDELGRQAMENYSTSNRLLALSRQVESGQHVLHRIAEQDIENLRQLTSMVPTQDFDQAVKALCTANKIYSLGLRSCFGLSYHFNFCLRFFLSNVALLGPATGDVPEKMLTMESEDVLVAISFKRYTRETVEMAEAIRPRVKTVIGITDSELSPIARLADISLIVPTSLPSFLESYTSTLCLLNALIGAVALEKKEDALSALDRLEDALQTFHTYL
ncbi:MAG: MurR/RpiR family transcriptional regulator [Desulfovermiculus sp.]